MNARIGVYAIPSAIVFMVVTVASGVLGDLVLLPALLVLGERDQ